MTAPDQALPIEEALPRLRAALAVRAGAVLVAPPGAGKTTRVPLALMDEPWARGGRIVVLEPRRLAARGAADRMATTLGERVGETVGLRIRMDSRQSARTRVLVVTEGVFTRMIVEDPELSGVAAVLFDEFHERSLDGDFGLALALETQGALRPDLRLLAMSATLEGARVADLMGAGADAAPIVESLGRAFPVDTSYLGRDPGERIEPAMTRAILRALERETGSILAFLPGQAEIARVADLLAERIRDPAVEVAPLYGALERRDQDRALAPAPAGRRKIVLATAVAETSLTIEGVRVVVDSGLARVPRYEPNLGLTRLETVRAARASVDQRRGRAGRTQPGVCYRLWEEAATGALPAYATPEILSADLSGLVLDAAAWGARDRDDLRFLDPPPAPAWDEAKKLLRDLGALDPQGRMTAEGAAIRALPLPPRLARMALDGARAGAGKTAADLAVLLSERGLGGADVDLSHRLDRFRRDRSGRAEAARGLARNWARLAGPVAGAGDPPSAGALVAFAYPERIARARGRPGEFLMANGRAASVEPHDALAREPWLAVAEIAGRAAQARILAAAPLARAEIERFFAERIVAREELAFDRERAALRARALRAMGALALEERALPTPATSEAAVVLAEGIAALGLDRLPWTRAQEQLRARVAFLRRAEGEEWPDLSDAALVATAADWLAPFLVGAKSLADIGPGALEAALSALVPYALARRMEAEAPTHFETPAGARHPIDYDADGGPAVHVRVQELFGLKAHPRLAGDRQALTLHLLSPAHRPIQITRDLPQFWKGSWADVRADMRGRYPKHVWPENPADAAPTTRAKPRG